MPGRATSWAKLSGMRRSTYVGAEKGRRENHDEAYMKVKVIKTAW